MENKEISVFFFPKWHFLFLDLLFKLVGEFARKNMFAVAELITRKCSRKYYHVFLLVTMRGAVFLWGH